MKELNRISLYSLVWLFAACGSSPAPDVHEKSTMQAQYSTAVADARSITSIKISRYLTPITNNNPALIWENGVVGSRLLVVTWLGDAGNNYKCNEPGGCRGNTSCIEGGECPAYKYDSWVTVAPELKNFFGVTQPEPLRIAQLLGLPPEYAVKDDPKEAKYILELWVSPHDLFRPCPDTEIPDTVCETNFPADAFRMLDLNNKVRATEGADYGVFKTYSSWFSNRTRNIYSARHQNAIFVGAKQGFICFARLLSPSQQGRSTVKLCCRPYRKHKRILLPFEVYR